MKASELRIGNQISEVLKSQKLIIKQDWVTIVIITPHGVGLSNGSMISLKEIEPIPLTEKWLLKFGFKNPSEEVFSLSKIVLARTLNGLFQAYLQGMDSDFVTKEIDFNLEIKYVHQLQNLYFALTGEELELQ